MRFFAHQSFFMGPLRRKEEYRKEIQRAGHKEKQTVDCRVDRTRISYLHKTRRKAAQESETFYIRIFNGAC